jgi:hypothetical protein
MVIRLALLICDTPIPAVLKTHGDYLAIFTRLFKESLPDPQVEFTMDGFDVVNKQEYPSLDAAYDGVVITGSGTLARESLLEVSLSDNAAASAYAELPWIPPLLSYIKSLAETKPQVRILGDTFHRSFALDSKRWDDPGKESVLVTKWSLVHSAGNASPTTANGKSASQMLN